VGPDGTAGVGPDLRAQLAGVGHALSPAAHWLRVADEWRIVDPVDQRGYVVRPSAAVEGELDVHRILLRFELGAKAREELRAWLSGLEPGAMLAMRAGVAHVDDTSGFAQDLSFLLRVAGSRARPLPLAPAFVLFEDPEYNRALATPSAHATAAVKLEEGGELVIHEVKLSADRRAYNAGSRIALRYDWDDGRASQAHLEVEQVSSGGVVRPLHLDGGAIIAGELLQFALTELKQATDPEPVPADLAAGDLVQFTLILADVAPAPPVVLQVEIVAEPVIPTPEAAYALLRWGAGEGPERVESVRFAWGPEASRVELVCPRDLLAETVRRRAVFLWHDSARPGTVGGYAVQKIARNGSTHFPGVVA
jgi:hypothetical protein